METATLSLLMAFFVISLYGLTRAITGHNELIREIQSVRHAMTVYSENIVEAIETGYHQNVGEWTMRMFERITDVAALNSLGRDAQGYIREKRLEKGLPKNPSPPSPDDTKTWPPPGVSAVIRSEG